jgi:two-component system, cell cycle sensor histidine kinase PleC
MTPPKDSPKDPKDDAVPTRPLGLEGDLLQVVADYLAATIYRRILKPDGTITYAYIAPSRTLSERGMVLTRDFQSTLQHTHPDDREEFVGAIQASARDLAPFDHVRRVMSNQGQYRWIRSISTPRREANGDIVWDGVALDITAQKQIEASLHKTQQLITDVAANLPGVLYRRVLHTDGSVTYPIIVGKGRPMPNLDLFKEAGSQQLNRIHPDDEPAWRRALLRSAENLSVYDEQLRVVRPDGVVRWVRSISRPTRTEAAEYVWDGIEIDITEQKEAELGQRKAQERAEEARAQLLSLIETSPAGIVLYDRDDRFVLCNRKYRALYPDTADLQAPGTRFEDLLRAALKRGQYSFPEGFDEEQFLIDRIAAFKTPGEPVVRRIATGKWLQIAEHRTRDGGLLSVHSDITLLKEREQALSEARDAANAASRAKSAFLATVSHELRTPLNAIIGFSELMQHTHAAASEKQREYARLIHESGLHLLELVNGMLDVEQIEAGRHVLQLGQVDLAEIAASCVGTVKAQAAKKGVRVINALGGPLGSRSADERALRQVFLNLLANAIKFTDPGGEVTVRRGESEPAMVRIIVSDTGIGIAREHLDKVLEPFHQVDATTTRKHGGIGLGLTISKRLVELHGGTLHIESEEGVGTRVIVTIPR